ncbi:MAG: RND family transporter [Gammaproteobacteria bacterium]|nr:RND family transporter [Gammaproteobacteria bacterium]
MVSRLESLYNGLVIRRPRVALLLLALVLSFFAYWAGDFRLDASADSLVLESDEDLQRFRELGERYASREFVFVTFTPPADLFSDSSLQTIVRLKNELAAVKGVESVVSLVDIPLVMQKEGTLLQLAQNYRKVLDEDVDRERARTELVGSPLFSELVISKDGRTTALQLNLEENAEYHGLQVRRNRLLIRKYQGGLSDGEEAELERIDSQYESAKTEVNAANHQRIDDIRNVIHRYAGSGELHLGGVPMIADDMISFVKSDLVVFGAGVFVFLVGMLTVIFRKARWVFLPLLSCICAGIVMVGLLGFAGWPVTVISSNFVSLMLIITMSMNVHLIVRYRQLRRDFAAWDQRTLVVETARKMVWPCLYTALTTMLGFGSLVISDIKPVIDFGWMMTLGLSVTFLISFSLFPAALVLMARTENPDTEKEQVPLTATLASATEKYGNFILIACIAIGALSIAGVTRLKVENSFVNYFSDRTEIHQGLKLIDDKLGGTTPLEILIKFPSEPASLAGEAGGDEEAEDFEAIFGKVEKADYWFTPDKVDLIKALHDYLDSLPAVGKVLSLASTVRLAESLTRGQEFNTFELAVLYKRLPPELRSSMIDPYVSLERDEARLSVRILDSLPDLRRKELLDGIRTDLRNQYHLAPHEFESAGLMVLYNNMLQSLFRSQILTLGVVMLGIWIMLLVLFRSLSLAIIGIIPNILAALMILGLMGWLDVPLDMMTITIASITIGIAVDNSIHYIYRFREELPRHGGYRETMHYCHASIGRAVFYTAIIIVVGFSILVFSNFIPTIYFGLLTALAMVIALILALTLLPQLILLWRPFGVAR